MDYVSCSPFRVPVARLEAGRIIAVGAEDAVMAHRGPATEVIDLEGRTMLPGFVDAHGHVFMGGLQALSANLLAPPDGAVSDIASLQQTLRDWTAANAEAVVKRDAVSYIRTNLEFHRTLYLRAQAPAMLAICETVWLQLGPTMRALYTRLRRSEPPQYHRMIIAALKAGDEPALRLAVRTDVTQGLRHLAS